METVFRCIRQAVPIRAILQELEVHILDHENGATACANVVLAIDGTQFTASSTDSDVIFAAARAFLTACQLVSHKDTEPVH
ncbi:2-isopropylmalate synthase [compost metagenome]